MALDCPLGPQEASKTAHEPSKTSYRKARKGSKSLIFCKCLKDVVIIVFAALRRPKCVIAVRVILIINVAI